MQNVPINAVFLASDTIIGVAFAEKRGWLFLWRWYCLFRRGSAPFVAKKTLAKRKGREMKDIRAEQLEAELSELLKKQAEFVESRSLGGAADSEILEYEVRQEIVKQMCDELGHSTGDT
jgi:hypothetical protein